MKPYKTRLEFLEEFEAAPNSTLFNQNTLSAIRDCSTALVEQERWAGTGIPYRKLGRHVRYCKQDILDWLELHQPISSTSYKTTNKVGV